MSGPWLEAFRRTPGKAIADLFSGRAGAGSELRLDVPELLYQQFPSNLADERVQLDDALWSWLFDMREGYASQVVRLGFSTYGKRVGDALIALQLLELPQTRDRIRADTGAWMRWLSPLRLAPERDPALECFRLLTRGQPDARHTALWLRLAADPRPEYLTVALAGLRLLPNQGNARKNQTLMLRALLRHAVGNYREVGEACSFFDRHFAALRGFFPRGPQHWNQVLDEALEGFQEHTKTLHTEDPIARGLADALRTNLRVKRRRPSSGKAWVPAPATREEWSDLKDDIRGSGHQPETLARRLFRILERNHHHAEATGVSHFFVRTLHNLGTALLKRHALAPGDMARFGVMIERALAWEAANPYCWMLWAEWFRIQDQREAHEATLRELLRLFPSESLARVELARLLIARGDADRGEAEHHLRDAEHRLRSAMDKDPGNERAYVVMARLLALRGRDAEAETILVEFLERHRDNATVRESLDRLRARADPDAVAAFVDARDDEIGGVSPLGAPPELLRRGRLAAEFSRARIATNHGRAASMNMIERESLKGDPLAGFYSQWSMPKKTPECPPHAWAWKACRYWQESASHDDWRRLAAQFPEASQETEFLRVLAIPGDGSGSALIGWHDCSGNDGASRPVDDVMREAQKRLDGAGPHERGEFAVTVMACAAADALDVVQSTA